MRKSILLSILLVLSLFSGVTVSQDSEYPHEIRYESPEEASVESETILSRTEGNGTSENPYLVENPWQLWAATDVVLRDGYDAQQIFIRLKNDIYMDGTREWNDGDGWNGNTVTYIGIDGNGKTIHNYYSKKGGLLSENYNRVNDSGGYEGNTIENLTFRDGYIDTDSQYVGALVNQGGFEYVKNVSFRNQTIIADSSADSSAVGTIGGTSNIPAGVADIRIRNVEIDTYIEVGYIEDAARVGGVYGGMRRGDVTNSYVNLELDSDERNTIGGIAGEFGDFTILNGDYIPQDATIENTHVNIYSREPLNNAGGMIGKFEQGVLKNNSVFGYLPEGSGVIREYNDYQSRYYSQIRGSFTAVAGLDTQVNAVESSDILDSEYSPAVMEDIYYAEHLSQGAESARTTEGLQRELATGEDPRSSTELNFETVWQTNDGFYPTPQVHNATRIEQDMFSARAGSGATSIEETDGLYYSPTEPIENRVG